MEAGESRARAGVSHSCGGGWNFSITAEAKTRRKEGTPVPSVRPSVPMSRVGETSGRFGGTLSEQQSVVDDAKRPKAKALQTSPRFHSFACERKGKAPPSLSLSLAPALAAGFNIKRRDHAEFLRAGGRGRRCQRPSFLPSTRDRHL